MKLSTLLGFLFGLFLAFFGVIMALGSVLNMVDQEREHGMTAYALTLVLLGMLPLTLGIFMIWKALRGSKTRRQEALERELLNLAKKFGGKLTITQVAMETTYSSQEAKELLNQFHANGLADMVVTDSGEVAYVFFGVGQTNSG